MSPVFVSRLGRLHYVGAFIGKAGTVYLGRGGKMRRFLSARGASRAATRAYEKTLR